ncbi:hypothetical protein [Caulobacter sp. BK020]|uniref:hypothetical protein n=1 Tax=Caulobacter sp. BK020 TaxID=2512117 RepID=UPI001046ABFC|nr:hypothetical protein [Caulobacter sp. BK020]TCS14569.1 hypothetical protein EV278_107218 [Caulobacter sp. BK020]
MAPYSPPPRDDDVVAWDSRRGVFLVRDRPAPRRGEPATLGEKILVLAAVNLWFWTVGLKGALAIWERLS